MVVYTQKSKHSGKLLPKMKASCDIEFEQGKTTITATTTDEKKTKIGNFVWI